jgi:hypothetical protein
VFGYDSSLCSSVLETDSLSDFWLWHKARRIALAALGQAVDLRTAAIGITALCYATDASWWDWDHDSAPFFWRWPSEFLTDMRYGIKPRFIGPPPAYRVRQRLDKDPAIFAKIRDKMLKLLNRGYLDSDTIDALMNYFAVSKGLSDIRMVFDGTKSGLNDSLWVPWFALPTATTIRRTVLPGYWCAGNDFGEQFYNYWLLEDLRAMSGVDVSALFEDVPGQSAKWFRWNLPAIGLKSSPYQAFQGFIRI